MKTMKNKKGLSYVVTIVSIVALALISIGIVWLVIQDYIEPKFTIYEELCHNETIFCHGEYCYYDIGGVEDIEMKFSFKERQEPAGDYYKIIRTNKDIYYPKRCFTFDREPCERKEVCEQVEVNLKDYENYTLDDCYEENWDGNYWVEIK